MSAGLEELWRRSEANRRFDSLGAAPRKLSRTSFCRVPSLVPAFHLGLAFWSAGALLPLFTRESAWPARIYSEESGGLYSSGTEISSDRNLNLFSKRPFRRGWVPQVAVFHLGPVSGVRAGRPPVDSVANPN